MWRDAVAFLMGVCCPGEACAREFERMELGLNGELGGLHFHFEFHFTNPCHVAFCILSFVRNHGLFHFPRIPIQQNGASNHPAVKLPLRLYNFSNTTNRKYDEVTTRTGSLSARTPPTTTSCHLPCRRIASVVSNHSAAHTLDQRKLHARHDMAGRSGSTSASHLTTLPVSLTTFRREFESLPSYPVTSSSPSSSITVARCEFFVGQPIPLSISPIWPSLAITTKHLTKLPAITIARMYGGMTGVGWMTPLPSFRLFRYRPTGRNTTADGKRGVIICQHTSRVPLLWDSPGSLVATYHCRLTIPYTSDYRVSETRQHQSDVGMVKNIEKVVHSLTYHLADNVTVSHHSILG